MKKLLLLLVPALFGCSTDADIAARNLSVEAEQFRINRRIVFYNGITDTYMLTVEGRCSIEVDTLDDQLELTCKDSELSYKKHYLGLSDNVTYFIEQLDSADINVYHYKVIFKPKAIIPNIILSN